MVLPEMSQTSMSTEPLNELLKAKGMMVERGFMPDHVLCGCSKAFFAALEKAGAIPNDRPHAVASLFGMPVYERTWMPKDRASIVSADGRTIKVFEI